MNDTDGIAGKIVKQKHGVVYIALNFQILHSVPDELICIESHSSVIKSVRYL